MAIFADGSGGAVQVPPRQRRRCRLSREKALRLRRLDWYLDYTMGRRGLDGAVIKRSIQEIAMIYGVDRGTVIREIAKARRTLEDIDVTLAHAET